VFLNPIRSYPFAQTVSVLGCGQLLIVESNIRLLYHFEKRLFQEEVEIPFDSVRQAKSSFSQIKLGLNWGILMQNWARIAINKSDPKRL
jgi:hypothetical protein